MNAEIDYDLTPDQWEMLKALRAPAPERRGLNRSVVENLVALGLAVMTEDRPVITCKGRGVLLRGSSRPWGGSAFHQTLNVPHAAQSTPGRPPFSSFFC